jgi:hypothetical protein
MENLMLGVRCQVYEAFHGHPEHLEPTFVLFQTMADGEYAIQDVAVTTKVRIKALCSWCERPRTDPQWRPSRELFCENRRFFSDDTEKIFADFIRINFVELGRPLTRATLQSLILILVQDLVAQGILNDAFLHFKCSGHFLSRFLDRTRFTFPRARPER